MASDSEVRRLRVTEGVSFEVEEGQAIESTSTHFLRRLGATSSISGVSFGQNAPPVAESAPSEPSPAVLREQIARLQVMRSELRGRMYESGLTEEEEARLEEVERELDARESALVEVAEPPPISNAILRLAERLESLLPDGGDA